MTLGQAILELQQMRLDLLPASQDDMRTAELVRALETGIRAMQEKRQRALPSRFLSEPDDNESGSGIGIVERYIDSSFRGRTAGLARPDDSDSNGN